MKKLLFIVGLYLLQMHQIMVSQIPVGYYDDAVGTGDVLRMNLRSIITSGHTSNSYDDLYTYYESTDNFGSNKVWDIYSMDGNGNASYYYYFNSNDECGSYNSEADCYNREHSVPQSWFGGSSPMYADLFIVIPTDGYVNNIRSNYPYGVTSNPTYISSNGSKKGSCTYPGYTGIVFEPINAYKGDIARAYFYIVTRYNVSSWSGASFNGDGFSDWTKAMLLEWNDSDPVSTKEINRNEAVYDIQGNRNPYIDHPEWVCEVFGADCAGNVDNPANLTAMGVSVSQINITWTQNPDNDAILLAYSTSNAFGTPTGTYSVGNTIAGGGTVLAVGDLENYDHTSLSSQTYYYRIWSKNSADEYSSGITVSATPLMAEPSNHVTNFIAYNPSSSTLDISWTDATGSVLPSKYLIKANYFGNAITAPIDGIPENDGLFTKNIAYGTQFVKFTGLIQNTDYVFQIFPYTNSGSNINYKTDGSIPETSGTTIDIPDQCGNETFGNLATGSSAYTTVTWTGQDGSLWTATDTRTDQTLGNGAAVCVRNGYVQSGTLTNGIGSISISTKRVFTGSTGNIIVKINGIAVGTVPYTDVLTISSINNIDVEGDIVIKLETPGTGDRIVIDDIIWTCFASTPNDADTEAIEPVSQIPSDNFSSLADTEAEAKEVFSFDIEDKGTSDGLITRLLNIKIYPAPSNTADWTDHIQGVVINNGDITIASMNITDESITIETIPFDISDGQSQTVTLSLWLNSINLVDGAVLAFMIDADNHGFVADDAFSGFAPVFNSGNNIVSNHFSIDVTGTELSFIQDATHTPVNEIMNPAPQLFITDIAGNPDTDFNTPVTLSSTGTLQGDPLSGSWDNAYSTFPDVIHTETGSDLQLSVVCGTLEIMSQTFTIYCYPGEVDNFSVECTSGSSEATWTNPDCINEALLVVHTSSITGIPEGTYSAHSPDYSDPLNPDFPGGGKVVYNGTVSPQTITGLTNNQSFYFKMFVNNYGYWSAGTELNCMPLNVNETLKGIDIYPNPANDLITIELSDNPIYSMKLYDITGKEIMQETIQGHLIQLNVSHLPEGIYIAEFRSDHQIIRYRILIDHY